MMERSELDDWLPYKPPRDEPEEAEDLDRAAPLRRRDKQVGQDGLDADAELALWQRWHQQDTDARAQLIAHYMPYAKAQAARLYARRPHDEFEFNEYFQFAMVGLLESIDRYQLGKGAQFKTFAMLRIHGAVLTGLGSLSDKTQQIAMHKRLAAERLASLKEDKLSTPASGSRNLLQQLSDVGVGIALGMILDGSGMLVESGETIPDNGYVELEIRQVREQLWTMVKRLTEREREVIQLHYLQQKDFNDIAGELALSKGRISQLHRQGIARLRDLISKLEKCDIAF